jgi:chromate transporter
LTPDLAAGHGSAREVFAAFLKLGLTAFGGPIAHLGHFRNELVLRRRWLNDADYADLVALCQFLPGPASSQLGFAIGLRRAGAGGALAAFVGFTLPSALFMTLVALAAPALSGRLGASIIHGLKLVAVAIVAQAVWAMARTLTPDARRAAIAALAAGLVWLVGGSPGQMAAIIVGAGLGWLLCTGTSPARPGGIAAQPSRRAAPWFLGAFIILLLAAPLLAMLTGSQAIALFDAFYRSGALVFGGGHVVLPLLEAQIVGPGWMDTDTFLTGYGAVQAMPGPLFSLAAYLGAAVGPEPNGLAGAAIALLAIFLPGFLVLLGVLPLWDRLRGKAGAQAALRGTNAAVVGILAMALYDPVWTGAITGWADVAIALAGFAALVRLAVPPFAVVIGIIAVQLLVGAVQTAG